MTGTEIRIPTNHSEQLYSVHITVSFVGFSLKATSIVTRFHWQITFYMQLPYFAPSVTNLTALHGKKRHISKQSQNSLTVSNKPIFVN